MRHRRAIRRHAAGAWDAALSHYVLRAMIRRGDIFHGPAFFRWRFSRQT